MEDTKNLPSLSRLREIALAFLKIGATAYGGPAIMGIMQAELQEKRQWVSKQRFMEGLSLVNLLPGAAATQLGIFLGYVRGGWWGGLLAGVCFVLPALLIMLGLTVTYDLLGTTPLIKSALYGLGPVVLAIFVLAIYRLGRAAIASLPQLFIALGAATAAGLSPLGIVPILALAATVGLFLFYSRRLGAVGLVVVALLIAAAYLFFWSPLGAATAINTSGNAPGLFDLGSFFLMVGALSFGGGLTLIAFIQEQVVSHNHWLTHREFIDGLALGQLTPGPILMVAAYVGYKVQGAVGALVAAVAIFLPAFVLMLSMLPMFARVRGLLWTKAVMKGIGPAVIGVLAVSLLEMAPHALPDRFAIAIFVGAIGAMLAWRLSAVKAMVGGAMIGIARDRISAVMARHT